MRSFLRTVLVCLATVIGFCVWLAAGASAASPDGMRLYVFSSGWLNIDKSGLQTGATGKISVPVAFFLIKHPKGNVLFETGNNDKIITDPTYWGPLATALTPGRSPDVAIDVQLDKVGVKPSDINYVGTVKLRRFSQNTGARTVVMPRWWRSAIAPPLLIGRSEASTGRRDGAGG